MISYLEKGDLEINEDTLRDEQETSRRRIFIRIKSTLRFKTGLRSATTQVWLVRIELSC